MTVSNKTLYAVVDEWVKRFGVRPSTVSKTALVKELEKCFMEDMEWEYVEWCSCKDGPADSSCTPDCIDGVPHRRLVSRYYPVSLPDTI